MKTVLHNILAPEGAVARRLGEKYEFRPQQLEMASAVADALAQGRHLLVEAGTGVGKSFAYLLPVVWPPARSISRRSCTSCRGSCRPQRRRDP
ncbi:MAG TPA: hypothetical protein VHP11_05300, partial [Tepidisphaeraceae bacterium]|nr:hypothetical protein [Tepidisphaeraceae bacterium]